MGLFFKIFFTSGGGDTLPPAGTTTAGVPFAPSVLLAALGVAVIGLGLHAFVIPRFYDRPFETLLLTWGIFLISTEVIKIVFGTDLRTVANPLAQPDYRGLRVR